MRKLLFAFLCTLCLLTVAYQPTSAQGGVESEVLQAVNQVRARYNLPAYRYNTTLALAAQNQANWMAQTGIYRHTQTNGSTPYSRAVAVGYSGWVSENIVGGTNLTARQGVVWWENSPVHFNGLVSPRYIEVGVGFAVGQGQNMYVLVMGLPDDGLPNRVAVADQPQDDVAMIVTPIELSPPDADGGIMHVVQPGQTAWAIAARYEVRLDDLLYLNQLNDGSLLSPGDELIIRLGVNQTAPPTATPAFEHTVKSGESLWTIAVIYNIDIEELRLLNQLYASDIVQPGQAIKLRLRPGEALPPTPTPVSEHIVREGETLLEIAWRYGASLEEIRRWNNLTPNSFLQIGQRLVVRAPAPMPDVATLTPPPTLTSAPPTFTPDPILALVLTSVVPTIPSTVTPTPLFSRATPTPFPTPTPFVQIQENKMPDAREVTIATAGILFVIGLLFLGMSRLKVW